MRRHHAAAILIAGALAATACDGRDPSVVIPTAPTAPAPVAAAAPPPASGITIAGRVHDTGLRPLGGAIVEVVNGPNAGTRVTTLSSGAFALSGDFDADTQFRATKDGYQSGVKKMGSHCAPCNPHFWVYFYLGLPDPPADIAGDYLLTVTADEACTALPPEARSRTYTATIIAEADQPTPANTFFRGRTGAASLVTGLSWEGLWFAVAGNYIELTSGDLHGQPGLLEEIAPRTYFSFGGIGQTTLESSGTTTIRSLFEGEIVYCVLKPDVAPLDGDRRYNCSAERAVTRVVCPSFKHQLIFTRR